MMALPPSFRIMESDILLREEDKTMNLMSINGEYWVAVLSDGRVMTEEMLCDEPKRISPWGKLMELCESEKVHVTLLQIHVAGRVYQSPVRSHNPERSHNMEPRSFLCMRRSILDGIQSSDNAEGWIGYQCEFRNGAKLVTWINVVTGNSYSQVL